MKTVSRQRMWQIKKRAEGKCEYCGEPNVNGRVCQKHLDYIREQNRIRARIRLGIPLDKPVNKRNPVVKEWANLDPDHYRDRYAWASNRLHYTPEELERQAQDLLIFANMLRKYQHENP